MFEAVTRIDKEMQVSQSGSPAYFFIVTRRLYKTYTYSA